MSRPPEMSRTRVVRRHVVALALACLTAGCGPLINLSGSQALTYYKLTPAGSVDNAPAALPIILMIEPPVSSGDLDTSRIALRPSPLEVKYYAKVKWADRAPRMIQNLLVTSFENARLVKTVGTEAMAIPSDFRLKTTLRDLQADYPAKDAAPVIHVTLSLKLIRKSPLMSVSSTVITSSVQATKNKMPEIMAAFDTATRDVLAETLAWTLTAAAQKDAPAP